MPDASMDAVATLADRDEVLLLIGSDHGHQTVTGVIDIDEELVTAGLKENLESTDVVVASNGTSALLYVHPDFVARTPRRSAISSQSGIGRNSSFTAVAGVGGTIGDHGLAFAVSMRASDEPNEYGVAGSSLVAERAGDKARRSWQRPARWPWAGRAIALLDDRRGGLQPRRCEAGSFLHHRHRADHSHASWASHLRNGWASAPVTAQGGRNG